VEFREKRPAVLLQQVCPFISDCVVSDKDSTEPTAVLADPTRQFRGLRKAAIVRWSVSPARGCAVDSSLLDDDFADHPNPSRSLPWPGAHRCMSSKFCPSMHLFRESRVKNIVSEQQPIVDKARHERRQQGSLHPGSFVSIQLHQSPAKTAQVRVATFNK
jgi:hypothetical protein